MGTDVKKEEDEMRSAATTMPSIGRAGPIPALPSPFDGAPAMQPLGPSPSSSMASSKDSSMREVLQQQHAQQAAGPPGLMPPPPLLQGDEAAVWVQRQWRPAIPLGKAASLTLAMSITRSGSGRRALPAADTATSPANELAGSLAPPPPLSPAADAAAAAALAGATSSGGGGSDRSAGRLKKLGRPIAFQGDPNSAELTEAERRHIRRRELNRASARRVRAKASATLSELAVRLAQMEQHNAALASQVATVEADRAALQQQVATMERQLKAAATETARLRQDQAAAQQQLHQQYQAQAQAQALQHAAKLQGGAAMPSAAAAMVTSGFNRLGRVQQPTINIARRGVTVTSAVPTSWAAQQQLQQPQQQQRGAQVPAAGPQPASAAQHVTGIPQSAAQQPQAQPPPAEPQAQQEQRQTMRTRQAAVQAQAAAHQREHLQQQQLRRQHPPIGSQQPGGASTPATNFGQPIGLPSHFSGQGQQLYPGGDSSFLGRAAGMPAIPSRPQSAAASPQLQAQQAAQQKQAELRASLDGGFGRPLDVPGFDGGDADMRPTQAGATWATPTSAAAAPSSGGGYQGLPGSALAYLNPAGMAHTAGMPSMPSLSFLNNDELMGDGAGHMPLDFTMTQASLELLSLSEMMGNQVAPQPNA